MVIARAGPSLQCHALVPQNGSFGKREPMP
jgi:hypothetical protein